MKDLIDEMHRMGSSPRDNILDSLAYILDVAVFPSVGDPEKKLVVPEHLKMTDEEREKEFWKRIPDLVRPEERAWSDDVEHLY